MHTNVRRFIKTGIGFLMIGLAIGAFMIVRREIGGVWPERHLVSAHAHAVQVGFVMYLILGVALWLFPKSPKGDDRYRPARIVAAYWTLTSATAWRIVAEVGRVWLDGSLLRWSIAVAGILQLVGFGIYFWILWPRIRSVEVTGGKRRASGFSVV